MSLIAGMDNVVEYIKQLEQEKQKLQDENKKMKDMLLKFKKECDEVKDEVKQLEGEKLELQLNKDKAVEYLKTDEQELEIYKGMVNNILIELYSAEKNDALINTDDIAEIVDYEEDKDKAKQLYYETYGSDDE
jgi:predicted RNase H-like nuclease (RuvC/YqgF family)